MFNLLRELRQAAAPEQLIAYVGGRHAPAELQPTAQFSLAATSFPTDRAPARIFWEQFVLPRRLRGDAVGLLHGTINALPIAWRGPSVVTILDLTFLRMPQAFHRGNRTYLTWAVRHAARSANRIITISEATRQDVIRLLGVPGDRVTRIYCGVEERYQPLRGTGELDAFRARRQLPDDFILYLGTMEPRKNVARLVQAYTKLRGSGATTWPLVLAGGKGWGEDAIFAEIERSNFASAIRYVGYVPEDEMPLWYNAATIFVYPSEYAGFGLPPLEALACGTPVLTSDCSSLPEVVGDAGILVDPTDTDAIADGMRRMIGDPTLRSDLAEGGPVRASTFTWERMARETLTVYREVGRS